MKIKWILVLAILVLSAAVRADEVHLKNGQIWTNIKVLDDFETEETITIFTSMKKDITLNKKDIVLIKKNGFDPLRKSELITPDGDTITNPDQNYYIVEEDNNENAGSTISDALLLSLPRLRLNVEAGYAFRTVKIPAGVAPELSEYMGNLKSGLHLLADITYFFHKEYGLNFKYSRFSTSALMNNITLSDEFGNQLGPGSMEDKITMNFIGVGVTQRKIFISGKTQLIGNLTVGSLSYRDNSEIVNIPIDIKGSALALSGLVGLDFSVSPDWALGASISYMLCSLKKFKANGETITANEPENLNRFDFNVGIKYYFDIAAK